MRNASTIGSLVLAIAVAAGARAEEPVVLKGHQLPPTVLQFGSDGSLLSIAADEFGSRPSEIALWDITNAKTIWVQKGPRIVWDAVVHTKGDRIFTAGAEVEGRDIKTGARNWTIAEPSIWWFAIALSSDGKYLLTGGSKMTADGEFAADKSEVVVRNAADGKVVKRLVAGESPIQLVAMGTAAALAVDRAGNLYRWSAADWSQAAPRKVGAGVCSLGVQGRLAVGFDDRVEIFTLEKDAAPLRLEGCQPLAATAEAFAFRTEDTFTLWTPNKVSTIPVAATPQVSRLAIKTEGKLSVAWTEIESREIRAWQAK